MKFSNWPLRNAHSFRNNTSKLTSVLAAAEGQCEACEKSIRPAQDFIKWDRRFGIFHKGCFGTVPSQQAAVEKVVKEVDAEQVRALVHESLSSYKVDVPEMLLVTLIDKAMAKRAPWEIRVGQFRNSGHVSHRR
jgi:hypothetical protein